MRYSKILLGIVLCFNANLVLANSLLTIVPGGVGKFQNKVGVGTPAYAEYQITNTTAHDLKIQFQYPAAGMSTDSTTTCAASLPHSASCILKIQFIPQQKGIVTGGPVVLINGGVIKEQPVTADQIDTQVVDHLYNILILTDFHAQKDLHAEMDFEPSMFTGDEHPTAVDGYVSKLDNFFASINDQIQAKNISAPDLIITLGDLSVPSSDSRTSDDYEKISDNEKEVFRMLREKFPNTPIFYTFGNHDAVGVTYGSFRFEDPNTHIVYSPYLAAKDEGWVDGFLSTGNICTNPATTYPCIITEDTTNGYYSAYLAPKMRLITLNTVLFSAQRPDTSDIANAAIAELSWFGSQMQQVAASGEHVLFAMHVPPGRYIEKDDYGDRFWKEDNETTFLGYVATYKDNIIGMLAGHTHYDELKIIRNNGQNIGMVLINPSIATFVINSPGFKTLSMTGNADASQYNLADYVLYRFYKDGSQIRIRSLYDYHNYYCANLSDPTTNIFDCLSQVTPEKMGVHLTIDDPNYPGPAELLYPQNIFVDEGTLR